MAALRSSFFGVSDRDIAAYVLDGGYLAHGDADLDKESGKVLAPALQTLSELSQRRRQRSVPRLLDELFDETRILAALTGTKRGEAQIANLEKVAALARGASGLGVLTLRGFIGYLRERIRTAREEPDLPATRPGDPNTVRILTIHRARARSANRRTYAAAATIKTIRRDSLGRKKNRHRFRRIAAAVVGSAGPGRFGACAAESLRRAYGACTAARDWLVVASAALGPGRRFPEDSGRAAARTDADVT